MDTKYTKYIEHAKSMGALNVVYFQIQDIDFDERTLLKCAFGCKDWSLNHTCPSASSFLGLDMYKRILSNYSGGLIIHCDNKKLSQEISFDIESKAYVDGYYWAFSLSDCGLCNECLAKHNKPCANKTKARPAFHSVGIDVFATVSKLKLPLKPLREMGEQQNWYSAVWLN